MIPVTPVPEPKDFDANVRQPGNLWLTANPTAEVKNLWSPYLEDLADGLFPLCAYSAIYCPVGTVDHYLSKNNKNAPQNRALAYEWSNYRYAAGWVNSSKGNEDAAILDPHLVGQGWFKIILPSLELVTTDKIPLPLRPQAEYTLTRLHLRNDMRVIRQRKAYYDQYCRGVCSLQGVREFAPLLADAIVAYGKQPHAC